MLNFKVTIGLISFCYKMIAYYKKSQLDFDQNLVGTFYNGLFIFQALIVGESVFLPQPQ